MKLPGSMSSSPLLKLDSQAQDSFPGLAWWSLQVFSEELPCGVPCFWEGGKGGRARVLRGPGSPVHAACKACRPTSGRCSGIVFSEGSDLCFRIIAGSSLEPWRPVGRPGVEGRDKEDQNAVSVSVDCWPQVPGCQVHGKCCLREDGCRDPQPREFWCRC